MAESRELCGEPEGYVLPGVTFGPKAKGAPVATCPFPCQLGTERGRYERAGAQGQRVSQVRR